MTMIERPSPNFDGRDGQAVDMLVLHYTGMPTAQDALARLCDPAAKVSAHYVVDEDGTVYRLVDEGSRAWHAGVSYWRGNANINQRSIGIEIVNPGHEFGYRGFPPAQMDAVTALCRDIVTRHAIPQRNIVAHSDVAPMRKEDPGEKFPWENLAGQGIGIWPRPPSESFSWWDILISLTPIGLFRMGKPEHAIASNPLPSYSRIQAQLAEYGYDCPKTGILDEATGKAIFAFQRHFFPQRLTGKWDRECALRLAWLLSMV